MLGAGAGGRGCGRAGGAGGSPPGRDLPAARLPGRDFKVLYPERAVVSLPAPAPRGSILAQREKRARPAGKACLFPAATARLSGYSMSAGPPSHAAGILGDWVSCCAAWAGCVAPMGPGLARREVQRSVHAFASRQYQRTSAQAWPPSATIWWTGSWMPHMAHATAGAVARRRSSRGAACGEFHGAGSCIIGPQPVLRAPWPGASPPLRRHVRPRFLHMI
jgi:hypothetical protein